MVHDIACVCMNICIRVWTDTRVSCACWRREVLSSSSAYLSLICSSPQSQPRSSSSPSFSTHILLRLYHYRCHRSHPYEHYQSFPKWASYRVRCTIHQNLRTYLHTRTYTPYIHVHTQLTRTEMTEIYNRQSLQEMLRIEEERGQVKIYQRKTNAITVKYHSTAITTNTTTGGRSKSNSKSSSSLKGSGREGRSFVGFMTELPFENADELKQPYAKKQKCCITGGVAKYRDPQTGKAFSSLEAFKTIRSQ